MVSEVKFLTPDEVLAKREADPQLLLLDVRTEEEWEAHHACWRHPNGESVHARGTCRPTGKPADIVVTVTLLALDQKAADAP